MDRWLDWLIERNASQKSVICIKYKIQLVEKCKNKFVKKVVYNYILTYRWIIIK